MRSALGRLKMIAVVAPLLGSLVVASVAPSAAQNKTLESTDVTIGVSVNDSTFLPIYLGEEAGLYKAEGLNVKVLAFRGGSDLTRAVVAGSVQIGVAAPTSVLSQCDRCRRERQGIFGGFNQAPFFWYAVPSIKTMAEAKGKRIGITRFGLIDRRPDPLLRCYVPVLIRRRMSKSSRAGSPERLGDGDRPDRRRRFQFTAQFHCRGSRL